MNKSVAPLLFAGLLLFSGNANAVFTDVSSNNPYYDAITSLQDNGIIEGYEDGSYRPDQQVNRAEALKIILLGSDVLVPEIQKQDIFPDVLYGTWYAKFAAKAKNLSIISGDSNTGMFRPGDTINLAEILKILLRTNKITTSEPDSNPYADVPADAWFAPYFDYASSISLLPQNSDENVSPATLITRGLMAQLMYQLKIRPEGYSEGEASYYGEFFHGKGTANGEVFDASKFTAAHRTLPFNTYVRVRNLENGKEVTVRINDRGPYAGKNRIIDLSKAAFESISPLSRGVINVSITPVGEPSATSSDTTLANCPASVDLGYLDKDTFENITLDDRFPSVSLASEVFSLSGISASKKGEVSGFAVDENERQFPFYAETDDAGFFDLNIYFPGSGEYQIGLLPGDSGSSVVQNITVLDSECLLSFEDNNLGALDNLDLDLEDGNLEVSWTDTNDYEITRIRFIQGDKEKQYIVYNDDKLIPNYPDFENWQNGQVKVLVQGANLKADRILEDQPITWGPAISTTFNAETHFQYIITDGVNVISIPQTVTGGKSFLLKFDPLVNVAEEGFVVLPSGQVEIIKLSSTTHNPINNANGTSVYPASANDVRLSFMPADSELHFAEVNDEEGQAVINIPIYPKNTYPLLPNPMDLANIDQPKLSGNVSFLQNEMLKLVNRDRSSYGVSAVSQDSAMNDLAQSKAEDMAKRSFFSHWNPDGITTNELRKNFAIPQYVSENIARDVSMELAEYGLIQSASHRENILNSEWKRAGFGIAEDPGNGYIFVQLFSDDPIDFSDPEELRNDILTDLNANRTSAISLFDNLNDVAQNWSERMVSEDFFDFSSPNGDAFVDTVRNAGIDETLGTFILGNSSFESAIKQITENLQLLDSRWKRLGLGIKQDKFGIIKITLAYTE